MEKNIGGYDRLSQFIVGSVLIILGAAALSSGFIILATNTLGVVLSVAGLLVGAVLTAGAITQKCLLNALLGVNTY